MYRFASIAMILAAQSAAAMARQAGQMDIANMHLRAIQPQRIIPRGGKRHSDGRPKKRRNAVTVSRRVRRKHRRAA